MKGFLKCTTECMTVPVPGVKASPKNMRNNSSAEMSPAKYILHNNVTM